MFSFNTRAFQAVKPKEAKWASVSRRTRRGLTKSLAETRVVASSWSRATIHTEQCSLYVHSFHFLVQSGEMPDCSLLKPLPAVQLQVKCRPVLSGKYSFRKCVNLGKLVPMSWPFTNLKTAHHPQTIFHPNMRWLLPRNCLKIRAEQYKDKKHTRLVTLQIRSGQVAPVSCKGIVNPKESFW